MRTRTLVLDVPQWPGHQAGQHVDVRLVAEGGYQAQRSYSIAPLMAMLRHHALADPSARAAAPVRLLYSARTLDDVIYHAELEQLTAPPLVDVVITLTREAAPTWTGFRRRIDRAMLEAVSWPPTVAPRAFVCGPTTLVESVATLLEYAHGMGVVLRCPTCDTPVLRIVRTPGFLRLDRSGILLLTSPESVSVS